MLSFPKFLQEKIMTNENDINQVENYIRSMSQQEKDSFRFGMAYTVSEISAYIHQMIDKGKTIDHDLLTSMEHHYLQDLRPDKFDETLRTILQK
jgi:uncharacterized protein YacL (UPF0231 family)